MLRKPPRSRPRRPDGEAIPQESAMYVILTSKPGQFRTEIGDGLRALEAYDYLFYGQKKAHFVIAELVKDSTKIRVVEDETEIVNDVPCKFLEKFETSERAYKELEHLTTFGHMQTALRKTAVAG
jgi:hypothetical protein